jgi:cytochrome b561
MPNASLLRSERYGAVARLLHWVLAAALVAIFALGLYMHELPFSPQRLKLYNWHKWAGMAILVLSFLRLAWRWKTGAPPLPASVLARMPGWQQWAHQGTHFLLYALFFAVPLAGWAYSSAAGFPIVWFGVLPLPDWVPVDKELAGVLKEVHKLCSFALAGLVLLHVAAVVKHQWLDRDGLLDRMRAAPRG